MHSFKAYPKPDSFLAGWLNSLTPLSLGALLFQASPFQREGGLCLCTGTRQAVETCTWKKHLAATMKLCLRNSAFGMVVPASSARQGPLRSPIQLAQSSIESANVKGSGVKSSKTDLFFVVITPSPEGFCFPSTPHPSFASWMENAGDQTGPQTTLLFRFHPLGWLMFTYTWLLAPALWFFCALPHQRGMKCVCV